MLIAARKRSSKLLDLQRQTLHELSGLNQDEAMCRLLEILDAQLQKETGAMILALRPPPRGNLLVATTNRRRAG